MSLEFDPRTGFSQKEDHIGQLLISRRSPVLSSSSPSASFSSVPSLISVSSSSVLSSGTQLNKPLDRMSQQQQQLMVVGLDDLYTDWERYSLEYPHGLVLLPGNEVHIVVNADTEYEKKDSANHFGLKCQVVGYEWTKHPADVSVVFGRLDGCSLRYTRTPCFSPNKILKNQQQTTKLSTSF